MSLKPWWKRLDGILEAEISAFQNYNMQPNVILQNEVSGQLEVEISIPIFGEDKVAKVEYPIFYPYFRPGLRLKGFEGLRHYDPLSGGICLLKQGTKNWDPTLTAAEFIHKQLPNWEEASSRKYKDDRLDIEDTQAEPISGYIPPANQLISVDRSWKLPAGVTAGSMVVAVEGAEKSIKDGVQFYGWAKNISDSKGDLLQELSFVAISDWLVKKRFSDVTLRWGKLTSPPLSLLVGSQLLDQIKQQNPAFYKNIYNRMSSRKKGLFAVCFDEEGPGGYCEGWYFFYLAGTALSKNEIKLNLYKPIAAEYLDEVGFFNRIPELNPLRLKTVAIAGLGCIGAPSVLEFAKAGVGEVRLLDRDYVSPGTICRWPMGLPTAGTGKVRALTDYIQEHYPYTSVSTEHHITKNPQDFRMSIDGTAPDQLPLMHRFFEGADLIYDATAEEGVNHFLSDLAREYNIPYVTVASRPGGWGGNVVRILPNNKTGCYSCYLHSLKSKAIKPPPYDPDGDELQPTGCNSLTFKAAGFDVQEIALAGVRMAVSTLCASMSGAYPAIDYDVGILSLRNAGKLTFPLWTPYSLLKHPACKNC